MFAHAIAQYTYIAAFVKIIIHAQCISACIVHYYNPLFAFTDNVIQTAY